MAGEWRWNLVDWTMCAVNSVRTRVTRDLITIVYSQFPSGVRDQLAIDVEHDPYLLRAEVKVEHKGRTWKAELQEIEHRGEKLRIKVPDELLSLVCVAV